VSKRAAKRQHRLSRLQCGRVAPLQVRQVVPVDLDHGQVSQFVYANHLRVHHPAIAHRHLHIHRAVHHVVVGHDITVRRNDDAATDSVLQRLLLLLGTSSLALPLPESAKRPIRPKELRKARRQLLLLALLGRLFLRPFRGHLHIHHCRLNVRRHRLHRAVQRRQRRNAAVVNGRRIHSRRPPRTGTAAYRGPCSEGLACPSGVGAGSAAVSCPAAPDVRAVVNTIRVPCPSCHAVTTTHCITTSAGCAGTASEIVLERFRALETGAAVCIILAEPSAPRSIDRCTWSAPSKSPLCRLLESDAIVRVSCATLTIGCIVRLLDVLYVTLRARKGLPVSAVLTLCVDCHCSP